MAIEDAVVRKPPGLPIRPNREIAMSGAYEGLIHALMLFAVIFGLSAIGLAFVRKWRDRSAEDRVDPNELMTNFRDLYERGGLSDEEFRTIKSKLASELRSELKDNSGAG